MNFIILTIILIVLITCLMLKQASKLEPKREPEPEFVKLPSRTNHIFYTA